MPFVTGRERLARREGMCEGIEVALQLRFSQEGLKLMPEIREIHEEEKLREILSALNTGASLEAVRQIPRTVDPSVQEGKRFRTTPERIGYRSGLRRSIEAILKWQFGEEGLKLMPEIQEIHEEEKLEAILQALETGASLEVVRQLWSSGLS